LPPNAKHKPVQSIDTFLLRTAVNG